MRNEKGNFLGFWSIVLLGINAIIGSGIFLLPGKVMATVGHWSFLVYLFATFLVLSIAWCFSKCSSLYNRNGGAYLYAKEAFGDFIGFEIGLMRWAVGIIAWAAILVGFITALGSIWPEAEFEPLRSIIILGFISALTLINLIGLNLFKQLNNIVTIAKLIPLIVFVLLGGYFVNPTYYHPLNWEELPTESFGSASLMILYAFGGFETLVVAAGEMKSPQKNLPMAIMIVIVFCSLLYYLIQLTAVGLLGDALSESSTPIVDAAKLLLGNIGQIFVAFTMLLSIGGISLAASFLTPRSGQVLAEDGLIPSWIGIKGRFETPVGSIMLSGILAGILALSGSFTQLIVISVVSRFAQYFSTCLAVYVLHIKRDINSTVLQKVMTCFIPLIALIGMSWLLLHATLYQLIWGLGALILGIPLYWIQRRRKSPYDVLMGKRTG